MIDEFSGSYSGGPLEITIPDQTLGWVFAFEDSEGTLSSFISERVDKIPLTDALHDWLSLLAKHLSRLRAYEDAQVLRDGR